MPTELQFRFSRFLGSKYLISQRKLSKSLDISLGGAIFLNELVAKG
jgi:hypothetical protein